MFIYTLLIIMLSLLTYLEIYYVDNTSCDWNALRFWSNNVRNEQV